MRIGLVSYGGGEVPGGPDLSATALAGALAEVTADSGHRVVLYLRRGSYQGVTRDQLFEVRELAAGPAHPVSNATALEDLGQFVRALGQDVGQVDVLHSHGWLAGLATLLAAEATATPVVHTFHPDVHTQSSNGHADPGRNHAERACAARADHLIATSAATQQALLRTGVPRHRITVIPPGIAVRQNSGPLGHRRARPGAIVGFGPPGRLADLIRALPALPPPTTVTLCGTPHHPLTAATGTLTGLADSLGVGARVYLTEGPTAPARAKALDGARVAVYLGPSAAIDTEHLEAMALGVPVITDNEVAAEAVVYDISGVREMELTPRRLAGVLRELLGNPVLRQQMSVAGRDRAHTRYHPNRIARETLRVYESVHEVSAHRRGLTRPGAPGPVQQVADQRETAPPAR
jgi:glycosyltransferase involved in cell wall biosynthesis